MTRNLPSQHLQGHSWMTSGTFILLCPATTLSAHYLKCPFSFSLSPTKSHQTIKNIIGRFCNKYYLFFLIQLCIKSKATLKGMTTLRAKRNIGYSESKNIWGPFSTQVLSSTTKLHALTRCQYQGGRDVVPAVGEACVTDPEDTPSDIKIDVLLIWRNWPRCSGSRAEKTISGFK